MFSRTIFSERLKRLIQGSGMTYAELAEILHLSTAQISDMANGKAGTSLERLYQLCRQFQISADYFLGLTDEPRPLDGGGGPRRAGGSG